MNNLEKRISISAAYEVISRACLAIGNEPLSEVYYYAAGDFDSDYDTFALCESVEIIRDAADDVGEHSVVSACEDAIANGLDLDYIGSVTSDSKRVAATYKAIADLINLAA